MFESLRHHDFRFLWVTSFLSAAARNLQQISLGWLAFDLTGSGVLLGVVLFIYQSPFLVLSLPIGALTDRVNRKRLLSTSQFAMAAVAVLLAIDIALGAVRPWHLMVFAFVSGVENTIIHIVRQTLVPRVVPRESLLNAIALNTTGFNIARILAPGVGGLLIVAVGVAGNFGIQAALLVGVALASMPMRVGRAMGAENLERASVRVVTRDMGDAVRYVWRDPMLRMLFGVQYVTLFFAVPFINFMPVWTTDVLLRDASSLGVLYMVSGGGAIVGTLWLAHRGDPARRGLWLLVSVMANALGLMALSQVSGFAPTLVLLAYLGAVQVIFFSLNMTAVQSVVPDAIQGRCMALYNLGHGSIALGTLTMGFVVESVGVQPAMWIMGAPLLAITVAAMALLAPIRRMA